jgi:hypothetical protein
MRLWLTRAFYSAYDKPPSGEAMQGALAVLEARARIDGPEAPAHVRIAAAGEAYFLDLCDPHWRSVAIRPDGWEIVPAAPAPFRRPAGLLALPEPRRGGSVELLRSHVNVRGDDFLLLVTWLAAAMRPEGPYPVLALAGEQGTAKSTLARMLRQLCDPHVCALRSSPREPRDLMISATNSWVVALDNISTIAPWLSDAICRLATGGGYATRTLYENDEETFLDAQRPIILNGIVDYATRGDLIDRCLFLHLATIPEANRRPEEKIWNRWDADYPLILGAMLDAVSGAMRRLPSIRPDALPRMADFAMWAQAVCLALGWDPAEFTRSYLANRQHAHETILEDSPVAGAVRTLFGQSGTWTGTATELLGMLADIAGEKIVKSDCWPKSPRKLSGELRRVAPTLRVVGIDIAFKPGGERGKQRIVDITATPESQGERPSAPSAPSAEACTSRKSADATADGRIPLPSAPFPAKHGAADDADDAEAEIPLISDEPPF